MTATQTAPADVKLVAAAFVLLSETLAAGWGREVDHDATYDYLEILTASDFVASPAKLLVRMAAQVWFAADSETRVAAMGWL